MNNSLALVMIVRNEELNLPRCLESAAPHVDEIIIVDTGSNDRTKEIAAQYGARIYDYVWNDNFAAARNYALDQSLSAWNLVLDADEIITAFDRPVLFQYLETKPYLGRIKIVSVTEEQGDPQEAHGYITRLLPAHVRYQGCVHEQVQSDLERINVPITVLHDGYLHRNKSDRNIPLLLAEAASDPDNSYIYFQLGREYQGIGEQSQACRYFERSLVRLSGQERYAPNVAVHYIYALKETKQYAAALKLIQADNDWLRSFPDYHFACGVFYLDLVLSDPVQYIAYLPNIEASYNNCLTVGETDRYDTVAGTGSYLAMYNLAIYYEIFGRADEAIRCLKQAASLGYEKAQLRLTNLNVQSSKY